jgi:uncharacterized protein (TIGR02145 family)
MMFASACSNGDGQSGPAPIVTGTMTDIEGNVYPTVIIGKQEWMAANLKTTTYNDGTPIPQVTDASAWSSILLGGAYSWYDNDLANKEVYGALYNWSTVETGKLCPTGWDVPVSENWGALTDYLGGKDALGQNLDGKVVAGGKLKEKGTLHWQSPNTGATNASGFTALPGGRRSMDGSFQEMGQRAYWWCQDQDDFFLVAASEFWALSYDSTTSGGATSPWEYGDSMRCLRN